MLRSLAGRLERLFRTPRRTSELEARSRSLELRVDLLERTLLELRHDILRTSTHARDHTNAAVAASQVATIAAAQAHSDAVGAAVLQSAREHTDLAVGAAAGSIQSAAQQHADENGRMVRDELSAAIAVLRRELRSFERTAARPRATIESVGPPPPPEYSSPFEQAFYVALEDRFRGDVDVIADRQRVYLDIVSPVVDDEHPVLDLGCGRGEWLRLLRETHLPAVGVDTNAAFVLENQEDGLEVIEADMLEHLRKAADGSVGAITLFQVVEHVDVATLLQVFIEAARALRPEGVLIAETPNALNLQVAAANFWIDPTHLRPLHPEFLRFCATYAGFSKTDGLFVNELDPTYREISDPTVRSLAARLDGPGDFALLAWS
jgi:O-antigen chain-terminating methyltransferase